MAAAVDPSVVVAPAHHPPFAGHRVVSAVVADDRAHHPTADRTAVGDWDCSRSSADRAAVAAVVAVAVVAVALVDVVPVLADAFGRRHREPS